MKLLLAMTMMLLPVSAMAGLTSKDVFQKIDCRLLNDGVVLKEHSEYMMNIRTDLGYAKFSQIQFGDEAMKIQYQLFIEDDIHGVIPESLIFLQNLMIGETESSVEISGQKVSWVKSTLKGFAVQCDLAEPVQ